MEIFLGILTLFSTTTSTAYWAGVTFAFGFVSWLVTSSIRVRAVADLPHNLKGFWIVLHDAFPPESNYSRPRRS